MKTEVENDYKTRYGAFPERFWGIEIMIILYDHPEDERLVGLE